MPKERPNVVHFSEFLLKLPCQQLISHLDGALNLYFSNLEVFCSRTQNSGMRFKFLFVV